MILDAAAFACAKCGFEHRVDLDGKHDAQRGFGIVVHLEFGVGGFGWFVVMSSGEPRGFQPKFLGAVARAHGFATHE